MSSSTLFPADRKTGVSHDDAIEATTSNPNSQDSSFPEASASQHSQLAPSSARLLELLTTSGGRDATTPSTSLSNYSSQENVLNSQKSISDSQIIHDERDMSHSGPMAYTSATTESRRAEYTGALKRTATGQIKSPLQGSLPTSPVDSSSYGHSRNTSTTSKSSHIGEVSNPFLFS